MKKIYVIFLYFLLFMGCNDSTSQEVVVYTALDRAFSEPIIKKFEKKTGIHVRVKYDSESTKTVGLTACIMEEKMRPRCDVFWNNEIINTLRLQKLDLLDSYFSPTAAFIPKAYKDVKGYWTGFAARARVLIVNTEKVKIEDYPKSIFDLTNAKWKGKCGIAKPVAGTTASHVACLFSYLGAEKAKIFLSKLKKNKVSLESGNKQCARKVADGELFLALTDTDDAMIELRENKPVAIIYLDKEKDAMGTLFIPNTLALIKNSPNQNNGQKLIDFLLSAEVENILARSASAQIPLNIKSKEPVQVKTPKEIKNMSVDFHHAASLWNEARNYITTEFLSTQ